MYINNIPVLYRYLTFNKHVTISIELQTKMAEGVEKPPSFKECCNSCKEKLDSLIEEWTNNFKMCYCPWKSKTYDIDGDSITNDRVPLLTVEKDKREITAEKDKMEDDVFLPVEDVTVQIEVESKETKDEEMPAANDLLLPAEEMTVQIEVESDENEDEKMSAAKEGDETKNSQVWPYTLSGSIVQFTHSFTS